MNVVRLLPQHLVHHAMHDTVTIICWLLLGSLVTAAGGWTAYHATNGRRVSAGMALTVAGVIVFAAAVWYHRSVPN